MEEEKTKKKKPGPIRKGRPGPWKPGVSGNPSGRPRGSRNKKTVQLSDDLLSAAEKTFEYYDVETGKMRRKVKGEFVTELVLRALTTGFFEFPATDENSQPTRIAVSSGDIMKLVQFYFTRLEGTPTKKKEEIVEDDSTKISPEDMEALAKQRWANAADQLQEVVEGLDVS